MDIEHCFSNLTTELLPLKSFLVCTINIFPIRSQTGPKYTEQWSVLLYKAVSFVTIGRQKDVDVRENKACFFFFLSSAVLCVPIIIIHTKLKVDTTSSCLFSPSWNLVDDPVMTSVTRAVI